MNQSHWQYKTFNSLTAQPVDISKRAAGAMGIEDSTL
jgi:hypothetical protein